MPREQNETGEFVETFAAEDALDVFDAVDGPVILSADVADHFDVTRETARRKLKELYELGALDRRKVSRRVIYWRPRTDTEDAAQRRGTRATTGTPSESATTHAESDADDPVGEVLDGWEPDTQADAKTARTQTRRVAAYLREHEPERFTRSELVDALAGDSTLGERSWWKRAVRPGLLELADGGLVEYRAGHHDYRWVGHDEE